LTTSLQRCSRPLCNSQTTTNPNPPANTHPTRGSLLNRIGLVTEKTNPTPTEVTLVPSGPNRMSERNPPAAPPNPIHTPNPKARSSTRVRQPLPATSSPVSPPMSTPHRHSRHVGSCATFVARCSLERR